MKLSNEDSLNGFKSFIDTSREKQINEIVTEAKKLDESSAPLKVDFQGSSLVFRVVDNELIIGEIQKKS